jgi:hypothetical protein
VESGLVLKFIGIRRIEKNKIEWESGIASQPGDGGGNVGGDDAGLRCDFEGGQIFADQTDGSGMLFHEDGESGCAADGFYADGAGSGKKIEETRTFHARAEDIENRGHALRRQRL